jgi:hypothetical protein
LGQENGARREVVYRSQIESAVDRERLESGAGNRKL